MNTRKLPLTLCITALALAFDAATKNVSGQAIPGAGGPPAVEPAASSALPPAPTPLPPVDPVKPIAPPVQPPLPRANPPGGLAAPTATPSVSVGTSGPADSTVPAATPGTAPAAGHLPPSTEPETGFSPVEKLPFLGRLMRNPTSPANTQIGIDDSRNKELARAKLSAELSADPQAAANKYASLVANFDSQRQAAAQAVFGLGEAYRRMKRFTEARVQYARILREFVDFPDLAQQSQKQLASTSFSGSDDFTTANGFAANSSGAQDPSAVASQLEARGRYAEALATRSAGTTAYISPNAWREERALIMEELELLNQELAATRERVKAGLEPSSGTLNLQREILRLRQELLRFPRTDTPQSTTPPAELPPPVQPPPLSPTPTPKVGR